MRPAVAFLLVLLSAGANAEPVTFPGPVAEAASPDGGLRVVFSDPGANSEGIHEYILQLEYPGGRTDQIDAFTRTADVSWSPSGKALYVTDHVTENAADCYVIKPGTDGTAKISLTEFVTQGRFPGPAWALQHSGQAAVTCDGWPAPDTVHFVLEGSGGDSPKGFHYGFTYDVTRGVAKPDRAAPTRRRHH
jgi:hypothetical protein